MAWVRLKGAKHSRSSYVLGSLGQAHHHEVLSLVPTTYVPMYISSHQMALPGSVEHLSEEMRDDYLLSVKKSIGMFLHTYVHTYIHM